MVKDWIIAVRRYGLAAAAPASVSAAHFVLQMSLIRVVDAKAFGLFAFILGFIQFGFGLSNALVSTPYAVCVNEKDFSEAQELSFFAVNLVFSVLWGAGCGLGALSLLGELRDAWIFGLFGSFAMIRWFGRSYLYALHQPSRAAISDFVYSVVILIGLTLGWFTGLSLIVALYILCAASIAGSAFIGRNFLAIQFYRVWRGSPLNYKTIWQDQARWTLIGVVSSEATWNAHSYVVTFFAGPAAFAPIAAATLLIRPIVLVLTSLTQLDRPVIARQLSDGDVDGAIRSVKVFRTALLVVWVGTIAAASAILVWSPHFLVKPSYDVAAVTTAFALWAVISLLQSWSTPASVLLQAAQWFSALARAGILAAFAAMFAVLGCILFLRPVDTLFGIAFGQIILNWKIASLETRWRHSQVRRFSCAALSDAPS